MEDKMMNQCDNPNLVRCFEVYQNEKLKVIVMEYCNRGNLESYLEQKGSVSEK